MKTRAVMVFSEKTIDFVDEGNVNHALTGTRVRVHVYVYRYVLEYHGCGRGNIFPWLVGWCHRSILTVVTEPRDQDPSFWLNFGLKIIFWFTRFQSPTFLLVRPHRCRGHVAVAPRCQTAFHVSSATRPLKVKTENAGARYQTQRQHWTGKGRSLQASTTPTTWWPYLHRRRWVWWGGNPNGGPCSPSSIVRSRDSGTQLLSTSDLEIDQIWTIKTRIV